MRVLALGSGYLILQPGSLEAGNLNRARQGATSSLQWPGAHKDGALQSLHAPYNFGMPNYRRWYVPGGTVYFTLVTYRRAPLFADQDARKLLGNVMREVCAEMPFHTIASVLLWDHLHTIWTLPDGDFDFSNRWKKIKGDLSKSWCKGGGIETTVTDSQARRGHRGIWQRRFWEHQVNSDEELEILCDYIHFNPVKHGYVASPRDWQFSTFHRWVAKGWYPQDWGASEPKTIARAKNQRMFGDI